MPLPVPVPGLRRALVALALLASGCAHRFPLAASDKVEAISGVPAPFGDAREPVPEGTRIRWVFGDGAQAEGAAVQHAFPHAGAFTVTETITDAHGDRSVKIPVEVARRSPLMAVPPDASSALIFDRFWTRFPAYRALLSRAIPLVQLGPALGQARAWLGFDPADPAAVASAGLDPDEGIASMTFAEDPGSRYLAIGTLDDAKSAATFQAILGRLHATQEPGPEGFTRAALPDESELYFKHDRGYLIVRLPPDAPGPALALSRFAQAPAAVLADAAAVAPLRARLPAGDVVAYVSPDAVAAASPDSARAAHAFHLGSLLAEATLEEDALTVEALWGADAPSRAALGLLFSSTQTPALLARAPAGATAYLGASLNLRQLAQLWLGASREGESELELGLAKAGLSLPGLVDQLGDAAGLAGYFDAKEYYRAFAETHVMQPRGEVLLGLRGSDPKALTALAVQVLSSDGPPRTQSIAGGTRLEATVGGHPAGAFVRGDELLLSWGLRHLDVAIEPPSGPRLIDTLPPELRDAATRPGRLVLYLDLAGAIDSLDLHEPVPGMSAEELMGAQLLVRLATAQLAPLRDLSLVLEPAPEGLHARATLRLR